MLLLHRSGRLAKKFGIDQPSGVVVMKGEPNRMISAKRIDELSSGKGVRKIAVENFLSTLGGMSESDAKLNLAMDARSYGWNTATKAAIEEGIRIHFHGDAD